MSSLIRLNFSGTKRYRQFSFLPRPGDRINISEEGTSYALDVVEVWFDDRHGEELCETVLNCRVIEDFPG